MGVSRFRSVSRVEDIPVYPDVCSYKHKYDTSFINIPVCEDDNGGVCFASQEDKDRYLKVVRNA